jgi:hypothetical protein
MDNNCMDGWIDRFSEKTEREFQEKINMDYKPNLTQPILTYPNLT